MNKRLERMLKNYPAMVRERDSIAHQIAHFKGLTAEEVIESMYTAHSDGERVQASNLSDKTAQIAMNYQDKMERINREWYEHLEKKYICLNEDITLFEGALESLSGIHSAIAKDMYLHQCTWDALATIHHVSRMTIARYKKKIIAELNAYYEKYDPEFVDYLLS